MTELTTPAGESPFDQIKRTRPDGTEYWSARELMPLLGYPAWREFRPVIERAMASAEAQGHVAEELFGANTEKTGGRPREDFHLPRYAAYLVAMNGDPRKPEVAAAQAYFVIRTREAEVARPQIPQTYAEALRAAADAEDARLAAERQIEQQRPKVEYVDQFVDPGSDLRILRVAANELGTREGDLRSLLLDRRWIYEKPMERRFDKRYSKWRTVTEYWPSSEKRHYFRMTPQHNAPRYKSGALRHTLNVTPPGMTALARMISKEIAL